MQKYGALVAVFVLLASTLFSPILFVPIAFSQEGTPTPTPEPSPSPSPTPTPDPAPAPQPAPTPTPTPEPTPSPTPSPEPSPTPTPTPEPIQDPRPAPVTTACSSASSPPTCGENQGLISNFDDKGCVTGYECREIKQESQSSCPQLPPTRTSCGPNEQLNKITDDKGCIVGFNCVSASAQVQPTNNCPPSPERPQCQGSVSPVFDRGCLVSYACVPQGCRQETDSSGFVRVVCQQERTCPDNKQSADNCRNQGGNPIAHHDQNGCQFFDCRFDARGVNSNPISGYQSCPKQNEIDDMFRKCESTGVKPRVTFEGGCKVVKCSQESESRCQFVPESERSRIESECTSQGFSVTRSVDNNGCGFYRCQEGGPQGCERNIPEEAYAKCDSKGGEMVVKNDRNGCVVFSQCVAPGDEKNAYVERVEEVPDTTVLLSLAIKMEKLKIDLDKLSDESKEIAKYYASTESLDEERYNRVATMFESAAEKVDEIKVKIRDSAESLSTDDLEEIRHDIKYIKEVTLKDILYVMLSNSDEVIETLEDSRKVSGKKLSLEELESNVKSCGTEGSCFDRAIRSCKPVSFQPDGRQGPSITIKGLEDGECVLNFVMQSDNMVPPGFTRETFYMKCAIKNYAIGVRGPQDILPYCEGPMASFAKQFGGSEVSGSDDAFRQILESEGGPGGCTTEQECAQYCVDNYDDCREWVKDHPAVGPMPSREELKRYASGDFQESDRSGPSRQQFSGPGGCNGPQECDRFCRNNPDECSRWCEENPDLCQGGPQSSGRDEFGQQGIPSGEEFQRQPQEFGRQPSGSAQQCVGCLNNGVCDIGECSECGDCLRSGSAGNFNRQPQSGPEQFNQPSQQGSGEFNRPPEQFGSPAQQPFGEQSR